MFLIYPLAAGRRHLETHVFFVVNSAPYRPGGSMAHIF